jgi:F1F0 ATPase subunit 2
MNETVLLVLSACAGTVIGVLYFIGLWLTVKRIGDAQNPGLLTFASFMGRTALSMFVFFLLVRGGHWERGLAALAGFIIARIVLVRVQKKRMRTRATVESRSEA